jgi:hypothetical protein
MRDELISPEETLAWALQARCKQSPGFTMILHTLPTSGHGGPTSVQDVALLEGIEIAFVRQIVSGAPTQSDRR